MTLPRHFTLAASAERECSIGIRIVQGGFLELTRLRYSFRVYKPAANGTVFSDSRRCLLCTGCTSSTWITIEGLREDVHDLRAQRRCSKGIRGRSFEADREATNRCSLARCAERATIIGTYKDTERCRGFCGKRFAHRAIGSFIPAGGVLESPARAPMRTAKASSGRLCWVHLQSPCQKQRVLRVH